MSAKPTPGPYRTEDCAYGTKVVTMSGKTIGYFVDSLETLPGEDMANARAWVDGMAAIETIARVREILERAPMGETLRKLREELLSAIGAPNPFTGEAKP